ncbi:D-aminoacyl-tRNA deacylase [Natrarchaeobius oligotrophus]|uniref:D-aminoacyl-tRNA deacylase n=1 Tax=Natrarchaeobius chitinivorans TaxID=1679083 RepID=A0A3N6MHF3_NATCH|nr:D-aminoacyl-tRNA deacylase [Natrarchaeobius chitinivorans]RQH03479.1 hypothetical protein EA472_02685 [Natrarchaeobius chitinivorans]
MGDLAIVESRADRASVHVCDHLRDLVSWEARTDDARADADGGGTYYRTEGIELRSFADLHLELERPAEAFDDPDLLVFASRHSGETGPLLTGHFTGNFGPAEYGGDDYDLADASPNALARLFEAFDRHAPDGYDVGLECTHHGPTDVGCPSLFAELGSGDEQWDDPAGAAAVARAILELRDVDSHHRERLVGFGGNHYVPRFERVVRETPWAVGHVAADWSLEAMGDPETRRSVIESAFETSDAEIALLDGDRPRLEGVIEELGYRVVSETWVREVGDRSRSLADAVEADLGTVDDGVRFGDRREESIALVDLPTELVDAAESVDPDRVRSLVERESVAFATENGGSRVGARAAVPAAAARAAREAIVDGLAAVLERKYETVTREDGAVVVDDLAFDPKLAREAGVPEGPKFGALAEGESVTVDGETITPRSVFTRRTRRFPI